MLALIQTDPAITMEDVAAFWKGDKTFLPSIDPDIREKLVEGWELAIKRTLLDC